MQNVQRTARWVGKRYRSEALRRRELRAQRKPLVRDARRAVAAAKALDPNGITSAVPTAERGLKSAQRRVPDAMPVFALKSAVGTAAAAYFGLPLVPGEVWAWGGGGAGTLAAGAAVVAIVRGKRAPRGLVPTKEERKLLGRLQPEHWREHCDQRGLTGTLTGKPTLTESGIVCAVRLDGQWTATKLRGAEDHVRALLGARTDLRIQTKAGKRGGWAELTIRTRSAADGIDLTGWEPGAPWGIDTVTGDPVMVPLGRRMLVAGASGSGKSWSTRALLGEASEYADHRLVLIDRKRVEALNWQHRARTAVTPDEILAATDELMAEMDERLLLVPRGRDTIEISADKPRITVFVDEGGELITAAKSKAYDRIMENLRSLARMGRAAEIVVIWATQKPTMSGEGHGIDSQIAAQITVRASLYLSTAGESMNVFGSDAIEKGWHAHELPEQAHALLRIGAKGNTHPIRTRAFSPADVIALPDRPIWSRAGVDRSNDQAPPVDMVKVPAQPAQDSEERILAALADGAGQVPALVEQTGLSRATVNRLLSGLLAAGRVHRAERGRYALAVEAA
ncbi:helix-turn-helix domain-containing protein [Streptomyces sp. NBC_01637]|uniref:helix-turn-helix domain-containing protein n=1 Tax=unclassified Streptomyces TaxID=2593676 RepID=UPI00386E0F57|nr:FtsK/SpoIIIE domain-containing protein [Streptomyces sp. NBC_01653]WTD89860.1 FtsK/SpoIIIE domain-containing protein [Streptomyces sp. NBC_01637]